MPSTDPYRYFKIEAREILDRLAHDLLQLEKSGPHQEVLERLRRDAHTLKGAARVVRLPRIAELAHAIEDRLAPYLAGDAPVPAGQVSELLRYADAIASQLKGLAPMPASVEGPPAPRAVAYALAGSAPQSADSAESFERVRVEIAEMDALVRSVSEALTHLERMRAAIDANFALQGALSSLATRIISAQRAESPDSSPGRSDTSDQLDELRSSLKRSAYSISVPFEATFREIAQMHESIDRVRLLPAGVLFGPMERSARDSAQTLEKHVAFSTAGGEHRLEGRVLSALGEALLHLVRNAVAHGIETPQQRAAVGKSISGEVALAVERRGNRMLFRCSDDGRGIDFEAIRRVVISRGLVAPERGSRLSNTELSEFLFQPGVTTVAAAGEVAGRGIGLDVVRQIASQLAGRVGVHTEPGRGTTVEIEIPLALSSMRALLVAAGGIAAWLPLAAVRSTMRIASSDLIISADRRSISFGATTIPFVTLGALLDRASAKPLPARTGAAVVIQSGSEMLAAGVDRVVKVADVVVHPLPPDLGAVPLLSGACFDARGYPQLVIHPEPLMEAALRVRAAPAEPVAAAPRILVIDDSLTSRMLEQSILENAGCEVDVAASAQEALAKAAERHYALFVCDIEMPGMDGFEFVAYTRERKDLRDIPSIMVTTRTGAKDRERAAAVGAQGYMVKSEFDEQLLLKTVRELVG